MKYNLNPQQLDRLSEILGNLGLIFFASIVLPILQGKESVDPFVMISGAITTSACLFMSLLIFEFTYLKEGG